MNKRIKIPRKEKSKRFLQLTSQLLCIKRSQNLVSQSYYTKAGAHGLLTKEVFFVASAKMHGLILNIMFRLGITYIVVSCISKIVRQFSEMFFKLLSDITRKMPVSHIKSVLGWTQPRGGSRIFFRRGCTRLLLYFNTNKPHSFLIFSEYQLY